MSIYQVFAKDYRFIPVREVLIAEPRTEDEAVRIAIENKGVYKNILHNFECDYSEGNNGKSN